MNQAHLSNNATNYRWHKYQLSRIHSITSKIHAYRVPLYMKLRFNVENISEVAENKVSCLLHWSEVKSISRANEQASKHSDVKRFKISIEIIWQCSCVKFYSKSSPLILFLERVPVDGSSHPIWVVSLKSCISYEYFQSFVFKFNYIRYLKMKMWIDIVFSFASS